MKIKTRKDVSINSGAMADIAFLLLIFFMVVTSLQRDKGIPMKLPPLVDGTPQKVDKKRVLNILLNEANQVMIEGKVLNSGFFISAIEKHLSTILALKKQPLISLKMHQHSNYQAYLSLLSDIKQAIKIVKQDKAVEMFSVTLEQLNRDQLKILSKRCSIRMTEIEQKL